MAKAKVLMKGNYAIAEAAVRAGCRFFAGYPITPQSELLEHMSWRLHEVGGSFTQTESEIAGVNMVMGAAACGVRSLTASSGPGFSLMQEGISYMASNEIPGVIVDVTRYASGIGDINPAQGDYLQLAKNGGHGDYRCIVLAPGSLQEAVDFMPIAFETAEKYRNPVIVAVDGSIGTMVEAVEFPDEMTEHDPEKLEWAIHRHRAEKIKGFKPRFYGGYGMPKYEGELREHLALMEENEQRWESYMTEDAEIILVAYGTMSRACKEAVNKARKEGMKIGLIRLQTLWPFPKKAFANVHPKAYLAVEMSIMAQMSEDIVIAVRSAVPTYSYTTGAIYPTVDMIIDKAKSVLAGKEKEV